MTATHSEGSSPRGSRTAASIVPAPSACSMCALSVRPLEPPGTGLTARTVPARLRGVRAGRRRVGGWRVGRRVSARRGARPVSGRRNPRAAHREKLKKEAIAAARGGRETDLGARVAAPESRRARLVSRSTSLSRRRSGGARGSAARSRPLPPLTPTAAAAAAAAGRSGASSPPLQRTRCLLLCSDAPSRRLTQSPAPRGMARLEEEEKAPARSACGRGAGCGQRRAHSRLPQPPGRSE